MPYELQRSGRGYYVVNQVTGRKHSNRPLPKSRARAQMRALYAAESGYVMRSRAGRKSPFAVRSAKRKSKAKTRSMIGGAADGATQAAGFEGSVFAGGGGMALMGYGCKRPKTKVCKKGAFPNVEVRCAMPRHRCPAGFESPRA